MDSDSIDYENQTAKRRIERERQRKAEAAMAHYLQTGCWDMYPDPEEEEEE